MFFAVKPGKVSDHFQLKRMNLLLRAVLMVAIGVNALAGQPADLSVPSLRQELSLDGPGWNVWLDQKAEWENDALYAPGEVPPLAQLPVNPPTEGWDAPEKLGTACSLPSSVEQIFAHGDATWLYHGVSWFSRTIDVPLAWRGKTVRLGIARAHLRVEIYVNHQLAGYDLCCESPCSFDLTSYLRLGSLNQLDIRVTNPGGSRGFDDAFLTKWGNQTLPSGRDFGGLDTVTLTATDPLHVESVFVMNQLPANDCQIQIIPTVVNPGDVPVSATLTAEILPVGGGLPLHKESWQATLPPGSSDAPSSTFAVPGAKLWNVDTPTLYTCRFTIKGNGFSDQLDSRFGFRVFEVKPDSEGKSCFYLNGKRFRHRSAIDFGFYANTGFFATGQEVARSVQAAKDMGQNGINLHRHIGEFRMLDAADKIGLALYEEPGGLHQWQGGQPIVAGSLADKVIQEKIRRMTLRDRNHPSLLIQNLSNEDNRWDATRKQAMATIHSLNPAILVCNASGHSGEGNVGAVYYFHAQPSGPDNHIRPYEDNIRHDFQDDHTVGSTSAFSETTFQSHLKDAGKDLFYYGEVFCHTGPANWWLVVEQEKESPIGSYDASSYQLNHDKIEKAFTDWNLGQVGSKLIKSPADVTRQAGRALMYTDGRLAQRIMSNNSVDGYAINGWSSHSYESERGDNWDSGLVDEGRNLKGPAEDFHWWVRPVQVALFRANGKYFKPGKTAKFEVDLINEGRIPAGQYQLEFTVTDGLGTKTDFEKTMSVAVKGGDTYAEKLEGVDVQMKPEWHAGHITLCADLKDNLGEVVATGKEQVLLANRASFATDLSGIKIAVSNWPQAQSALNDAQTSISPIDSAEILLAGEPDPSAGELLDLAKSGRTLILKFDAAWAEILSKDNILSTPVTEWGGDSSNQSDGWFDNGWGYLDHFVGNQAVPSSSTIGTNGWEVPGSPLGFYPFESSFKKAAYGLYMARPDNTASLDSRGKIFKVPIEKLTGVPDAGLFQACAYDLPPLQLKVPPGDYKITLRFCELFQTEPDKRVFDVLLQGKTVASGVDLVAKTGGPFKPLDLSFNANAANGVVNLDFKASKDQSCLSGIIVEKVSPAGQSWTRKICFGQPQWQDYSALRADEWQGDAPTLLVLLGTLDYGQGKIVLAPSYPVDANQALNDLLFFNLIEKAARKEW